MPTYLPPMVNLPAVAYVFNEGQPSAWTLLTLREDGMNLDIRCVGNPTQADGQTARLDWRA